MANSENNSPATAQPSANTVGRSPLPEQPLSAGLTNNPNAADILNRGQVVQAMAANNPRGSDATPNVSSGSRDAIDQIRSAMAEKIGAAMDVISNGSPASAGSKAKSNEPTIPY